MSPGIDKNYWKKYFPWFFFPPFSPVFLLVLIQSQEEKLPKAWDILGKTQSHYSIHVQLWAIESFLSYNLGIKCICLTSQDLKNMYVIALIISELLSTPTLLRWSCSDNHICTAWNSALITKTKLLVFSIQTYVFHFTLWAGYLANQRQSLTCCVGYGKRLDQIMLCSHWAKWWFISADARVSAPNPQKPGACWGSWLSPKSPLQPLVAAHLITCPVVQGRGGETNQLGQHDI